MSLFLSSFTNRLDQKGRISVPASFRQQLGGEGPAGLVLFQSVHYDCLEGFSYDYMRLIGERLENFDLFSSEQDDLATSIFGSALPLSLDGDGRIILPEHCRDHAKLKEQATFVGLGQKFQIWSPELYAARQKEARASVHKQKLTIPSSATSSKEGSAI